ncbi:hypothetical protein C8Q74DRAFT_743071 [Fomes fomentarius]|nr:hypothetical protein C8Q74DRAFT_743071 [Fomes fomentarius]
MPQHSQSLDISVKTFVDDTAPLNKEGTVVCHEHWVPARLLTSRTVTNPDRQWYAPEIGIRVWTPEYTIRYATCPVVHSETVSSRSISRCGLRLGLENGSHRACRRSRILFAPS